MTQQRPLSSPCPSPALWVGLLADVATPQERDMWQRHREDCADCNAQWQSQQEALHQWSDEDDQALEALLARGQQRVATLPSPPEELWDEQIALEVICDTWHPTIAEDAFATAFAEPPLVALQDIPEKNAVSPRGWGFLGMWQSWLAISAAYILIVSGSHWNPFTFESTSFQTPAAPKHAQVSSQFKHPQASYRPLPSKQILPPHRRALTPKGSLFPQTSGQPVASRSNKVYVGSSSKHAPQISFRYFLRRDKHTSPGTPEMWVQAGDEIRFSYDYTPGHPEERAYVLLFLTDAKGQFSRLYPSKEGHIVRLRPGKSVFLPDGIELDDAKVSERIFVCVSLRPISYAQARKAFRQAIQNSSWSQLKQLPLPCRLQGSWLLRKVTTPMPPSVRSQSPQKAGGRP